MYYLDILINFPLYYLDILINFPLYYLDILINFPFVLFCERLHFRDFKVLKYVLYVLVLMIVSYIFSGNTHFKHCFHYINRLFSIFSQQKNKMSIKYFGILLNFIIVLNFVTIVTVNAEEEAIPRLGALINREGNLEFTRAVLLVRFRLNSEIYIEQQLSNVYFHTTNLLTLLKHGGFTMSYAQKSSIESLLKSISYEVGEILPFISDKFVVDKLNATDTKDLEEIWRNEVYQAVSRINIGVSAAHVVPAVDTHIVETIVQTSTTTTKPQNDQGKAVHPKFKREKRALLDIGGNLLHSLFGVSTDDQLENTEINLRKEVESVYSRTEMVETQSKLAERKLADALGHVKVMTESLLSVRARENRIESYIQLAITLEHIESIVFNLHDLAVQSATHRTLLSKGIVPQVLDASQLRDLIHTGLITFRNMEFPLNIDELTNTNLARYLNLLHSEPTRNYNTFAIFIPFTDGKVYKLYGMEKFPFFTNVTDTDRKILMPSIKLPQHLAVSEDEYVEIESIDSCLRTRNSTSFLCAQKMPTVNGDVKSCATEIIQNNTKSAFDLCKYKEIALVNNYFASNKNGIWIVLVNKAELANIRCPDKFKFNSKILKAYSGTLKVRPPCVFTTPKFSLPTIQTKKENLSGVPVKVLPIEDIILNGTNITFPKKDLTAIEDDLNLIRNITSMHSEHLDFINGNVQNKPLHIIHGTTGILVVVIIVVVIIGIIVIRRKPNLLQQMLPFFLLNNNMSSHSQRTQHEDRRPQSEPDEVECRSPTPAHTEQPFELTVRQPVGQATGESGPVYAGRPSKPRRNLTLNLPPLRFCWR